MQATTILKTRGEIPIKKGFSITPKNYYVYLHIKEDDGTVFYVGKGTKHRWCVSFDRSLHWKNTAKKHGVVCQIVAQLGFPEIFNESCLFPIVLTSTTSTGTVRGGGKIIHG